MTTLNAIQRHHFGCHDCLSGCYVELSGRVPDSIDCGGCGGKMSFRGTLNVRSNRLEFAYEDSPLAAAGATADTGTVPTVHRAPTPAATPTLNAAQPRKKRDLGLPGATHKGREKWEVDYVRTYGTESINGRRCTKIGRDGIADAERAGYVCEKIGTGYAYVWRATPPPSTTPTVKPAKRAPTPSVTPTVDAAVTAPVAAPRAVPSFVRSGCTVCHEPFAPHFCGPDDLRCGPCAKALGELQAQQRADKEAERQAGMIRGTYHHRTGSGHGTYTLEPTVAPAVEARLLGDLEKALAAKPGYEKPSYMRGTRHIGSKFDLNTRLIIKETRGGENWDQARERMFEVAKLLGWNGVHSPDDYYPRTVDEATAIRMSWPRTTAEAAG